MVTKLGAKMKRQEMRRKKTKAKRMGNLNLSSFSEISMSERGKRESEMSLCREIGIRDRRVILERERERCCVRLLSLCAEILWRCVFSFLSFYFLFWFGFFFTLLQENLGGLGHSVVANGVLGVRT